VYTGIRAHGHTHTTRHVNAGTDQTLTEYMQF